MSNHFVIVMIVLFVAAMASGVKAQDMFGFKGDDDLIDSYNLGDDIDDGIERRSDLEIDSTGSMLEDDFATDSPTDYRDGRLIDEIHHMGRDKLVDDNGVYGAIEADFEEAESSWIVESMNDDRKLRGQGPLNHEQSIKAFEYYYYFSHDSLYKLCLDQDRVACDVIDAKSIRLSGRNENLLVKDTDIHIESQSLINAQDPSGDEGLTQRDMAKRNERYYRGRMDHSFEMYLTARNVGDIEAQVEYTEQYRQYASEWRKWKLQRERREKASQQ